MLANKDFKFSLPQKNKQNVPTNVVYKYIKNNQTQLQTPQRGYKKEITFII